MQLTARPTIETAWRMSLTGACHVHSLDSMWTLANSSIVEQQYFSIPGSDYPLGLTIQIRDANGHNIIQKLKAALYTLAKSISAPLEQLNCQSISNLGRPRKGRVRVLPR